MQQRRILIDIMVDMFKRGEMRNMVAMSILLAGFTSYLSAGFDADVVYRGS